MIDKFPNADWSHAIEGDCGEHVLIVAYEPAEGFTGAITIDITFNGRSVNALIQEPVKREEFARAWMEAERIANGELPAFRAAMPGQPAGAEADRG